VKKEQLVNTAIIIVCYTRIYGKDKIEVRL
jgi:hypothetical protein